MTEIRNAYGERRPKVVSFEGTESLTKQEFKDESDINRIMAKYVRSGSVPQLEQAPQFGDFSSVGDFQRAQELVVKSREAFESLKAEVRDRFHNDPVEFLEFCNDKANLEEGRKLGIFRPAEPEAPPVKPMEVVVVDGAKFVNPAPGVKP